SPAVSGRRSNTWLGSASHSTRTAALHPALGLPSALMRPIANSATSPPPPKSCVPTARRMDSPQRHRDTEERWELKCLPSLWLGVSVVQVRSTMSGLRSRLGSDPQTEILWRRGERQHALLRRHPKIRVVRDEYIAVEIEIVTEF